MKKICMVILLALSMPHVAFSAGDRMTAPQRQVEDRTALRVSSGQILNSFDGLKSVSAILVPIEASKQALLQVSGINHVLNGQTLLYDLIEDRNYHHQTYRVSGAQSTYLSFRGEKTLKAGTLQQYGELYFENSPIKVLFTKAHPAPQQILTAYLIEQRLAPTHQQHSADKITEDLRSFAAGLQGPCQQPQALKVEVDWAAFKAQSQWPRLGKHYIRALKALCREDADYRAEIQSMTSLYFTQSTDPKLHQLHRQGSRLSIALGINMPNVRLLARRWFDDNL